MSQLIYISNRRKEVLVPPPFGDTKSLDFDGSTEYLANTTAQAIGIADDWSISIWLKPHTLDSTEVIMRIADVSNDYIDITHFTTPKIQVNTRNSTGGTLKRYDWNGALSTNSWTHLVLTWNGTTGDVLKLYIDSVDTAPVKFFDNAGTMANSNRKVEIGAAGAASPFDGDIHSIGIWSSVLAANEVTATWNTGDGFSFDLGEDSGNYVSSANLVHWFQCGQPAGGSYPGDTYVRDRVPSGGIDISANAANISDADIVDTYPGE